MCYCTRYFTSNDVTPYAGVWIEIVKIHKFREHGSVTPYAGVWIEIYSDSQEFETNGVTPYAGVWIEISALFEKVQCYLRHSLRGSVD